MDMPFKYQTRNDPRFSYEATILIDNYPHGVHYTAHMVNFSKCGACLHTDTPFAPGKQLILAIENSPYPDCPGVYVAVVKWCRQLDQADTTRAYEIGIRYLSTRPEDLNQSRVNESITIQIGQSHTHRTTRAKKRDRRTASNSWSRKVLPFKRHPHKEKETAPDFRRHHRKAVVIPTHYTTSHGICWGIVKNINRNGIYVEKYIKNQDSLRIGDSIAVMMPSKITHRTVKILGEIVWMDADGYGVKFRALIGPKHHQSRLDPPNG